MEDRELYDIRSAARRVHRSRQSVYSWMRHGMPYRVVGGRRYIAHVDLLAALRERILAKRSTQFRKSV